MHLPPPVFFGILNCTPDSFSDGGRFVEIGNAICQATKLLTTGADYIDIGGESTRPEAPSISAEEEWQRIEPVLTILLKQYPKKISLDTRHWQTAERFLNLGGQILNDVSGFQDPRMIALAVQFQPLIIVNHFPGKTPGEVHTQSIDAVDQVREDLLARKQELLHAGVKASNIVLDPGIGFGKTMRLNTELLTFAKLLPQEKILIGYSRKRFLGPNRFDREVNIEAGKKAIAAGAWGLRVHEWFKI